MALHTPARPAVRVDARPVGSGAPSRDSRMLHSRLIGACFLLGFLVYGVGFALVSSVVDVPGFIATVPAHQTVLVVGALLMLANSVVDVGKGVLFFPILARYGRRSALAYFATMIVEVVLLTIGVIWLLMLVPIAQQAADAAPAGAGGADALASLAVQSNDTAYQIAELLLGLGCVVLCSVLFRARLVPRALSVLGLVGYPMLTLGTIAEIFGLHVGLALSIPGALFELTLGVWLLTKGFDPAAYDPVS